MADREFDLVLYGVTGFAGGLLAGHIARRAPAEMRVALAGRSGQRLAQVRASLPLPGRGWPVIVADAMDAAAMADLAARARAVATTVGPYARYGAALVTACARAGTHYGDLTGEVLFMHRSIEANHAAAQASGARIVHAGGFDSVPSDLGVWLLHDHARATGAGELGRVTGLLTGAAGGFSGGTVDSLRAQLEDMAHDPAGRRVLADPHALDPAGSTTGRPGPPERRDVHFDADLGYWLAPFVMAGVNTRVVRRSHALFAGGYGEDQAAGGYQDRTAGRYTTGGRATGGRATGGRATVDDTTGGRATGYGAGFRYREAVGVPGRVTGAVPAAAVAVATAGFAAAMSRPSTRRLVDRVLPEPGAGPSQQAMDRGWFRIRLFAETSSGRVLQADVAARLDPGYGATAVMLGEAALALAAGEGTAIGGVVTPAVALGGALVARLRDCGFTWQVADR